MQHSIVSQKEFKKKKKKGRIQDNAKHILSITAPSNTWKEPPVQLNLTELLRLPETRLPSAIFHQYSNSFKIIFENVLPTLSQCLSGSVNQ